MSNPIPVNILSDDESDLQTTPFPIPSKRHRTDFDANPPTVFIIDDDPTPRKPSPCTTTASTPSFVAETPMVESLNSYAPIVRCTHSISEPLLRLSPSPNSNSFGIHGLICLESDNESEDPDSLPVKQNEPRLSFPEVANNLELDSTCTDSLMLHDSSCFEPATEDNLPQVFNHSGEEDDILQPIDNNLRPKGKARANTNKKRNAGEVTGRTRITMEEKARLMNEKKQQKEQEKLQKAALKAQAAEMKKLQKEIKSWEKGKFSQQSIVAKIDSKVVEQGSVGGQLLTRLAEKGITFQITPNPVERSIVWTISVPENIAQALPQRAEIPYVLLVYEAEEFCRLVTNESLVDHVSSVQRLYPSHTICYLTNRLLAFINKREQEHYKCPSSHSGWRRPPFEELLAKLTTHFVGVHSRLCTDEAELAEHVVNLTCSLASCQFRKKLTRLSVNANGSLIPKDAADIALIKKNTWLKALIAIPKVQPRFAIAIWKKYPTMKSLLSVYMDPNKSEHEKEFLLEDLKTEGLVGDNRRLGEICSKRVYRILMAQCGSIKTDDVENGADFFTRKS